MLQHASPADRRDIATALAFPRQLLAARMAARVSPRRLSAMAGLAPDTVAAIEDGRRQPTGAEMAALAGALDMSLSELTQGVAA